MKNNDKGNNKESFYENPESIKGLNENDSFIKNGRKLINLLLAIIAVASKRMSKSQNELMQLKLS